MSMQRRWFMMTVVVSFLGVGMGAFFLFEGSFAPELVLGWAVAFIDHCFRSLIDRNGLLRRTLGLGMVVNGLRAVVFAAAILFIIFKLNVEKGPFLFSVFTVYFIFLVYSIMVMYAFPLSEREVPGGST